EPEPVRRTVGVAGDRGHGARHGLLDPGRRRWGFWWCSGGHGGAVLSAEWIPEAASSLTGSSGVRVGVLEDLFEGDAEHAGDLEGALQRRRVAALFDGDDGLPGHPDAVGELRLGHLAVGEAQGPDGVGDLGGLAHGQKPRRYRTILTMDEATVARTNAR